jgi:hypothetical protein
MGTEKEQVNEERCKSTQDCYHLFDSSDPNETSEIDLRILLKPITLGIVRTGTTISSVRVNLGQGLEQHGPVSAHVGTYKSPQKLQHPPAYC